MFKNPFKNSNDKSKIDVLWKKLESKKFDDVIRDATPLQSSASKDVVKDAHKLVGMSYFQSGNYSDSLPHFEKATEFKEEVTDWFNVMTSAALSKQIDASVNAFNKAIQLRSKINDQDQPSIPMIRQYYSCALRDVGEFKLALVQINELRKIYEELKITDDTFVYIRGVPFLSHTMDVAIDVFNGLGNKQDALTWINSFAKKLDEDGQAYLEDVKNKITC